jgi:hypothetical protein
MKNMLVISALSLALASGTALAQVSLGTGADANVSVDANVGGVNAGADVGLNANAAADTSAGAAGANLDTNVDVTADVDSDELDSETTAAVGAQGSVSAALDALDDDGAGFFTDDTRAEVRSQAEIETAFAQLSAEQQATLRAACDEGAGTAGGSEVAGEAGLCAAINQIVQ